MTRSDTDVSDVHIGLYISDPALIRFYLCVKKADQQWTTSYTVDHVAIQLGHVDDMAKLYSEVFTELLERHCPAVKVRWKAKEKTP